MFKQEYKIFPNPDKEFYKEISQAVKDNNGYCPCLTYQNEDTKCPCLEFREQQSEDYCHCMRYYKEIPMTKEEIIENERMNREYEEYRDRQIDKEMKEGLFK